MGSDDEVEQGENPSTSSDSFIDSDEDELLSPQHDEGLLPEVRHLVLISLIFWSFQPIWNKLLKVLNIFPRNL